MRLLWQVISLLAPRKRYFLVFLIASRTRLRSCNQKHFGLVVYPTPQLSFTTIHKTFQMFDQIDKIATQSIATNRHEKLNSPGNFVKSTVDMNSISKSNQLINGDFLVFLTNIQIFQQHSLSCPSLTQILPHLLCSSCVEHLELFDSRVPSPPFCLLKRI